MKLAHVVSYVKKTKKKKLKKKFAKTEASKLRIMMPCIDIQVLVQCSLNLESNDIIFAVCQSVLHDKYF